MEVTSTKVALHERQDIFSLGQNLSHPTTHDNKPFMILCK